MRHPALLPLTLSLSLLALPARADEGMWTFDAFPADAVRKAHGWAPDAAWLEKVRLGSLRIAGGCSASFVSPQGLMMTNHHCVRSCIQDVTGAKEDLLATGFYAPRAEDERRCPEVEVNQLLEIRDVTAELARATAGKAGAEHGRALKAGMTRLESECGKTDAARCEVVTLYNGGRYHLYRYRRFQDVRLAFAPEFPMAAFGGDPDNFHFPRFGFDAAFLRVWEGGKPVASPHFLPWAARGVKDGELVFVSGNPGGTERQVTVAELEFQRDVVLPYQLLQLSELRGVLKERSRTDAEFKRVAKSRQRAVENGLKALRGRHQALAEGTLLAAKRREEEALRKGVAARPALRREAGGAWDETRAALQRYRPMLVAYRMKEGGDAFASELFAHAKQLVRAAEELPKPNAERLREYTDARLPALRHGLLREAPVPVELEVTGLGFGLARMRELLGADDPFVQKVLGKESPEKLARRLVTGSKLADAAVRKALLEGGKAAVDASQDPLVVLARLVDADARAARKAYEDEVEAPLMRAGERVARARFAVFGMKGYPDATFTPRLSYGKVAGWDEGGRAVPAFTTFAGAYARHTGEDPFALPPSWLKAQPRVQGDVPLDVATTNDIIGGNSGSPLIDRNGHVAGLVFDGNLHSLGGRYGYDAATNRAVAVHGEGLLHGLEVIYGAERVAKELRATQAK